MTTNQPESTEDRLNHLETLLTDVGELVTAQNDAIDALTANLNNFAEQTNRSINTLVEQTNRNINALVEQAAADRQQAALDRQQVALDRQQAALDRQTWQAEIQHIWEHLRGQPGNGR